MDRSKVKKAPLVRTLPKKALTGRVLALTITPARALARAEKRFLSQPTDQCVRCGSRFVSLEPMFVHCHYCGRMMRIAGASVLAQELFELRAGLRLAS